MSFERVTILWMEKVNGKPTYYWDEAMNRKEAIKILNELEERKVNIYDDVEVIIEPRSKKKSIQKQNGLEFLGYKLFDVQFLWSATGKTIEEAAEEVKNMDLNKLMKEGHISFTLLEHGADEDEIELFMGERVDNQ